MGSAFTRRWWRLVLGGWCCCDAGGVALVGGREFQEGRCGVEQEKQRMPHAKPHAKHAHACMHHRFSGPTVHFVDEEYDTGPILAQRVVAVPPTDTPKQLAARVLKEVRGRLICLEVDLFAWRLAA